jgi:hypothetical protein
VRVEFKYAGGGLGKGGKVTLYTDGKKVGEGDVAMTLAMVFSADDGCDVGVDTGTPVSPDYGPQGKAFNGRIRGVQLAIAEAAEHLDHLVSPEEAVRIAMARQAVAYATTVSQRMIGGWRPPFRTSRLGNQTTVGARGGVVSQFEI